MPLPSPSSHDGDPQPPLGSVSLKCDPGLALGRGARYAAITPGYHLNKRHWNTVALDGSVPDEELLKLIDHSYELVVARLTRAQRNQLTARQTGSEERTPCGSPSRRPAYAACRCRCGL